MSNSSRLSHGGWPTKKIKFFNSFMEIVLQMSLSMGDKKCYKLQMGEMGYHYTRNFDVVQTKSIVYDETLIDQIYLLFYNRRSFHTSKFTNF